MRLVHFFVIASLISLNHNALASEEDETDAELIASFINSGSSESNGNSDVPSALNNKRPDQPTSSNEDELVPIQKKTNNNGQGSSETGDPSSENISEILQESRPCDCVKYFLCNIDNGTVVNDGDVVGLIDIRLGASKPSPCPHYFDICCQDLKTPSLGSVVPEPKVKFEHSVCGQRNLGGVGFRITGADNEEAQFGEFPWMVAIVRHELSTSKPALNVYLCGGSLIHPQVVLTAAHCVNGKEPDELKVRVGEWDTQTPDELYPHQDRFISKIVVHEQYYAGALFNDVALLYLDRPVNFAPNVDTICLPPQKANFNGQTCYASGWGKNSFGQDGKYQVILKKVELPIVPVDRCQAALRKTRLGPHFKLHDSFICAGGQAGRDTCRGDGGSPLVCQLPDSPYYVQVGIVSWGIGCGSEGTPGVYANIPKLVPWITEKILEAELETRFFKVTS